MAERSAKGILLAVLAWFVVIAALAVGYKYLVRPRAASRLADETGTESKYKHEVAVALDSFSGYCILRSATLRRELASRGVKLSVSDDGADYAARMKALRDGDVQMAVFTIDSLITSSAAVGELPATIVMVIDETSGADAIVAKKEALASLQDLDSPEARIVLTPNSPSEFLARIVLAHFSLPSLAENWRVEADGAAEVYRMFRSARAGEKTAYVLWEPYVSKAVEEGAQVLLDSSKVKGYIVDVLVARREFLRDNAELARNVVEAYLRTAYSHVRRKEGMVGLVIEDAEATGAEKLDEEQARKLVAGIRWKNTLENYAHFGLLPPEQSGGVQHLEDIINNITGVLIKTGALESDPLSGKASSLFYDGTLAELKAADFHPGKRLSIVEGVGPGTGALEKVKADAELAALTDEEWGRLIPVGELSVKPISFARGTSRINLQSQRELGRLASLLKSWPQYYLLVVGHARGEGDPEANILLARERAAAAAGLLVSQGVSEKRVKTKAAEPSGGGGSAQSVSFVLGQVPY